MLNMITVSAVGDSEEPVCCHMDPWCRFSRRWSKNQNKAKVSSAFLERSQVCHIFITHLSASGRLTALLSWWLPGDSVAPTIHLFPLLFSLQTLKWWVFLGCHSLLRLLLLECLFRWMLDATSLTGTRQKQSADLRIWACVVAVFEFFQHAE